MYLIKKSFSVSKQLANYACPGFKYAQARLNFDPPEFKDRFGVKYWTLVVGADNELGKCFSKELIALGYDVILVGTNEKILNELAR